MSKKNNAKKSDSDVMVMDAHTKHKKQGKKLNILLVLLSILLIGSISILTYLFVRSENAKIDAKNALSQQVDVGNANVVSYVTGYERVVQIFRGNLLEFMAIAIILIAGFIFLVFFLYKDHKKRKYHKQHFNKSHHNEPKPDKIHTISKYQAPWENIWLLLGGVLVVAVVGILVLRISQASTDISQNLTNLEASALEEQGYRQISSSAGFSLIYNYNLLNATAQTAQGTQSIGTKEELAKIADYTIVDITPSDTDTASISGTNSAQSSDLKFETSTSKNFFESAKNQYGNLSQVELTIKHFAPQNDPNNFVEKTKQSEIEISGVKYQSVEYKVINTEYVTTTDTITQYVTVINNQPFSISLRESSLSIPSQVQLLRNVISTIKYGSVEDLSRKTSIRLSNTALAATEPVENDTQAESSILSQSTTNVPKTLINDTALQVVAKNQPTVVRVGTNTCMNIDLLLPNGQVGYTAKGACNAVIGSGSIISSDGYISTNGHVISDIPEKVLQTYLSLNTDSANLKAYLQYLLDTGVLTKPQLEALIRQIAAGNKQAIEKFLTTTTKISPDKYKTSSVERKFVIQLSNDPIKAVVDKTAISIPTNDTKVSAKLIDKDFDDQTLRQAKIANIKELKTSDVAILKLDSGSNYPVSTLGSLSEENKSSSSNSSESVLVTAMGFPGFIDGGLTTKKETTIPSATQGKVLGFENIADNKYRLIATNVPAAQGNSGGPAFAEDGSIIGLVTYVDQSVNTKEGTESFATSSILRDVNDVKALLSKNNITLNTSSSVDSTWDQGIEQFSNAHYKSANQLFAKAKAEYPANYLATQLSSVADAKIAAGLDVPEISPVVTIVVVLFVLIILVGLIIVIIKTVSHHKKTKSLPPLPEQTSTTNPVGPSTVVAASEDTAQVPAGTQVGDTPNVYQPAPPVPPVSPSTTVNAGGGFQPAISTLPPSPPTVADRPAQISPISTDIPTQQAPSEQLASNPNTPPTSSATPSIGNSNIIDTTESSTTQQAPADTPEIGLVDSGTNSQPPASQ